MNVRDLVTYAYSDAIRLNCHYKRIRIVCNLTITFLLSIHLDSVCFPNSVVQIIF